MTTGKRTEGDVSGDAVKGVGVGMGKGSGVRRGVNRVQ